MNDWVSRTGRILSGFPAWPVEVRCLDLAEEIGELARAVLITEGHKPVARDEEHVAEALCGCCSTCSPSPSTTNSTSTATTNSSSPNLTTTPKAFSRRHALLAPQPPAVSARRRHIPRSRGVGRHRSRGRRHAGAWVRESDRGPRRAAPEDERSAAPRPAHLLPADHVSVGMVYRDRSNTSPGRISFGSDPTTARLCR